MRKTSANSGIATKNATIKSESNMQNGQISSKFQARNSLHKTVKFLAKMSKISSKKSQVFIEKVKFLAKKGRNSSKNSRISSENSQILGKPSRENGCNEIGRRFLGGFKARIPTVKLFLFPLWSKMNVAD